MIDYWHVVYFDISSFTFLCSTDSPRDSVQFIEWSPTSCPRALLIANFHGRITIWTQPSQVSCFFFWSLFYIAFCCPFHFLFSCTFGDMQVLGGGFLTLSISHLLAIIFYWILVLPICYTFKIISALLQKLFLLTAPKGVT